MLSSDIHKVMKAIAEGYHVEGINDRFVVVDNPEYKNPWDNPYIVVDIEVDFVDYEVLLTRVKELEGALLEIDALDPEGKVDGCSPAALRGLVLRMGEIARDALTKGKDNYVEF